MTIYTVRFTSYRGSTEFEPLFDSVSEKEGSDGDEAISEDNVVEEAITIPEEYLIAKSKDLNVESELAGDFE